MGRGFPARGDSTGKGLDMNDIPRDARRLLGPAARGAPWRFQNLRLVSEHKLTDSDLTHRKPIYK